MASGKLDMENWVKDHDGMTLAQAFGIRKGKVKFRKLDAKLPVASTKAAQATGEDLPQGDTNPPSAADEHDNYELAKKMAAEQPYNWTGAQFAALNNVVMAESGWNQKAENPSSGAYGIPQALPGSKMASAGKDWETDPRTQIKWMLEYIRSRYGTPSVAWAHEQAVHWY
jgi:resuscitation-promoting factor RpfB